MLVTAPSDKELLRIYTVYGYWVIEFDLFAKLFLSPCDFGTSKLITYLTTNYGFSYFYESYTKIFGYAWTDKFVKF